MWMADTANEQLELMVAKGGRRLYHKAKALKTEKFMASAAQVMNIGGISIRKQRWKKEGVNNKRWKTKGK